ncbi:MULTISPECIES: hypothetical protein [Serratia]|uniref:hypothetical protein n=1 Tax=Serratia TaxID=613 RepID=UPI000936E3D0|nr:MULTISPECIES: hypothetical protein [Serratia]OJT41505.1 hypothetical protein BSR04_11235 [Serratia plymuthica]QIC88431.1 hypothetical protein F0336_19070 [Serratia liquefaciens]RYM69483.1 hypothetical protein BSQ99_16975 [Serratia liquefaciens]
MIHIDNDNSASGVKVWVLVGMVALTISVVSFFCVRMVNTIDETESAVHAMKEVQAAQGEVIKGLQRDRDRTEREVEQLKQQVDRLKDEHAVMKGKLSIPLTLNSTKAAPRGGFFYGKIKAKPHPKLTRHPN